MSCHSRPRQWWRLVSGQRKNSSQYYVGKEVQHASLISIIKQEPTVCYHGREPVVRTGAAPNLGRKPDQAATRAGSAGGVAGGPRLEAAPV